jgi:Leucine-rich repeat (LRR) protein
LEGEIPTSLSNLSNLLLLDLHQNKLEGPIPLEIGSLHNLLGLDLSINSLTGVIPLSFRNLTQLVQLGLNTNQLEGSIPDELGTLSNLTGLVLRRNRLSGRIPSAIFELPSLQFLDIGMNMLGNELPPNIGNSLPNLQQLLLGNNMLEGRISPSLGNASMLQKIDLRSNNFIGQIPTSLGNIKGLTVLGLDSNRLEATDSKSWEFLYALRNCSLQVLSVQWNQLQGAIPNSIGALTKLQQLYFAGNNLSGIVPSTIGNLTSLILLNLSGNNLTGATDTWIANLTKLQKLFLQQNNFVYQIPASIANLTSLVSVNLSHNDFEGLIPPIFGSLTQLSKLDLSHNNLQGNISGEVFQATSLTKCILSYNSLDGSIPLEVGKLTQLSELDLSSNMFIGNIPESLGGCEELQILQLDKNSLTGSIPVSFGNLKILKLLNLSHNNLTGTIPETLADLDLLTKLDISYNHLQGEIPRNGVFENPAAVSLDGNWGLCGGAMNFNMPPCHPHSRNAKRQYYLIKILIPIFGFMSLVLLIYFVILEKKRPGRTQILTPAFLKQFHQVSYTDLAQATRDFSESNLIGRGSYGRVYRGRLKESKVEVAVKVFDLDMHGAARSFMSECAALRGIQHRNLLPIETACSTVDKSDNPFKALIYEFMPNGNLDTWLHHKGDSKSPKRLGLIERINIAVNIADALDYLHHDSGNPIIHCDLKPSNVLLDEDMNARLGDFGIARFYHNSRLPSGGSNSSIGLKGTIGYIAPGTFCLFPVYAIFTAPFFFQRSPLVLYRALIPIPLQRTTSSHPSLSG